MTEVPNEFRERIAKIIYDNVDDGGIGTQEATDEIRELIKAIIEKVKSEDFYHAIGKAKVWSESNDVVVEITQEYIYDWLKKEFGV